MKNRLLRSSLILAGIALSSSCSSTQPPPVATSGPPAVVQSPAAPSEPGPASALSSPVAQGTSEKASVTVYRKKRIVGLALHTSVFVDGAELAELENGAYVKLDLAPGPHVLHADEERDSIKVDLEPGKAYFFRMELVPGLWKGNGVLELVDEKTGAAEFGEWNLKLTKSIRKKSEVVVSDPGKP